MADFVASRRRDLKQSHDIRTKKKAAINNRNHVLIRLPPSLPRMEFSERQRLESQSNCRAMQARSMSITTNSVRSWSRTLNHHCQVPETAALVKKNLTCRGSSRSKR